MGSHPSKPSKSSRSSKGHSRSRSEPIPSRPPDDVLNGTTRAPVDSNPLTPSTASVTENGSVAGDVVGDVVGDGGGGKKERRISRTLSLRNKFVTEPSNAELKAIREVRARERRNSLPIGVKNARRMSVTVQEPKPMDLLCGKCFRQMPYGAGAKLCLDDRKTFCPPCVEDDRLNHNPSHKLVRLTVKKPESHPATGDIVCNVCQTAEPSNPNYASASCLTCDLWCDSYEICAHCLTEPDPANGWDLLKSHGETHLPAETVWAYYQPPGDVDPDRLMFERFGLLARRNQVIGKSRRNSGNAGVFMGKHGHVRSQVYAPIPF